MTTVVAEGCMNLTKGWFYCAEFASFGGIKFLEKGISPNWKYEDPKSWFGNIYGPFKTFGEAKRDAIEYFESDIMNSKRARDEVKRSKKGKIK